MIWNPDHPKAKSYKNYVPEHIQVMEAKLGRYLREGDEEVHHDNEDKQDNRIENLILMTKRTHRSHHHLGKHIDTSDRICFQCGSKTTQTIKPLKGYSNKTPYPRWLHLPWDKENWYCNRCYQSIKKNNNLV